MAKVRLGKASVQTVIHLLELPHLFPQEEEKHFVQWGERQMLWSIMSAGPTPGILRGIAVADPGPEKRDVPPSGDMEK